MQKNYHKYENKDLGALLYRQRQLANLKQR